MWHRHQKFNCFYEEINSSFTWLSNVDVLNLCRLWTNNNPCDMKYWLPTPSLWGFIKGTIVKVFMMMVQPDGRKLSQLWCTTPGESHHLLFTDEPRSRYLSTFFSGLLHNIMNKICQWFCLYLIQSVFLSFLEYKPVFIFLPGLIFFPLLSYFPIRPLTNTLVNM